MVKEKKIEVKKEVNVPRFTKEGIFASHEFNNIEKDFLKAFLSDTKAYSLEEVKEILIKKRKGVVK